MLAASEAGETPALPGKTIRISVQAPSWPHTEAEFRQETRDFLKAELLWDWHDTLVLDKASDEYTALAKSFTHNVGAKGWLAVHWPQEYGGLSLPS